MLRNCPHCGRLLTTPPGTPCATCLREEDDAVVRIQAYLDRGGTPSVALVAQSTGLKIGLLRRLVKSGRVMLGDASVAGRAVCAICGRELNAFGAKMCAECARRMDPRSTGASAPLGRQHEVAPPVRGGFYSQRGGTGT